MGDHHDGPMHGSYVVRVSRDNTGNIRGVVVRVATGERLGFADIDHAVTLLRELIEKDFPRGISPPRTDRESS